MSASQAMPHKRYTYTRTSDGEGGFSKTLSYAGVLYGSTETFENMLYMVVNKKSEVAPEDIVGVVENGATAYYEVKKVIQMGAAQHKRLVLSANDRPIRPVVEGEFS